MSDDTRTLMDTLSTKLLSLHKRLLDDAKKAYEDANGPIASINVYFQLVIDNEHFSWLRKFSSLVALIDEATMQRRLASEAEAQALLDEATVLLSFKDADATFNSKYEAALQSNKEAMGIHLEVLDLLK